MKELETALNTVLNNYDLEHEDLGLETHKQIEYIANKYIIRKGSTSLANWSWQFPTDKILEGLYKELEKVVEKSPIYIRKNRKFVINEILK